MVDPARSPSRDRQRRRRLPRHVGETSAPRTVVLVVRLAFVGLRRGGRGGEGGGEGEGRGGRRGRGGEQGRRGRGGGGGGEGSGGEGGTVLQFQFQSTRPSSVLRVGCQRLGTLRRDWLVETPAFKRRQPVDGCHVSLNAGPGATPLYNDYRGWLLTSDAETSPKRYLRDAGMPGHNSVTRPGNDGRGAAQTNREAVPHVGGEFR